MFSLDSDAFTTPLFIYDKTIDSAVEGHPVKGDIKINLNSKISNEDWNTHLKSYLTNKEVTNNKITYEDGEVETVVSGVELSKRVGVIWYDGHVGTKRRIVVGCAVYAGATGNSTTVFGNIGDMPVELQFIDYGTSLTIGSDLLNSGLVTPAADIVLTAGEIGCVLFLTAA